jgi:hypothetical protein
MSTPSNDKKKPKETNVTKFAKALVESTAAAKAKTRKEKRAAILRGG